MQIIPLQSVPSQTIQVNLVGQICDISVYQKSGGLFMDVVCSSIADGGLYGVLCENLNRIIRSAYLGFMGDFCFIDSQGADDPVFTGLGVRFNLAYLTAADLSSVGMAA